MISAPSNTADDGARAQPADAEGVGVGGGAGVTDGLGIDGPGVNEGGPGGAIVAVASGRGGEGDAGCGVGPRAQEAIGRESKRTSRRAARRRGVALRSMGPRDIELLTVREGTFPTIGS